MIKQKIALVFVAISLITSGAQAQIKIDLKTSLENKPHLTVAKNCIRLVLEHSQYFEVVEYGEDYSVWITDFTRYSNGVNNYVYTNFDIRSPAMFTNGDLITSMMAAGIYKPGALQGKYNTAEITKVLAIFALGRKFLRKATKHADKIYMAAIGDPSVIALSKVFAYLMQRLMPILNSINLRPTQQQISEGMLAGYAVTKKLENYFY